MEKHRFTFTFATKTYKRYLSYVYRICKHIALSSRTIFKPFILIVCAYTREPNNPHVFSSSLLSDSHSDPTPYTVRNHILFIFIVKSRQGKARQGKKKRLTYVLVIFYTVTNHPSEPYSSWCAFQLNAQQTKAKQSREKKNEEKEEEEKEKAAMKMKNEKHV